MKKSSIEILMSTETKIREIVSVVPGDSVEIAAKKMTENKIGLVVVIEAGKLVGVLSERDVVGKWVCGEKFPQSVKVSELMTRKVETVTADDTVFDCYLRFLAGKCRHLPVIDPFGQVLGVLSMRDVTAYVVDRLSEQSEHSEHSE